MNKKSKLNIDLLKKYDYISFDIFDTLVQRAVPNSEDIFGFTELLYKSKYGTEVRGYADTRKKIELMLWEKTSEGMFTFDNIFQKIRKLYGNEIGERLANIELEIERLLIVKNEEISEIYKYAIKNKKVIITSDMYLSKAFVEGILNALGIDAYEKIYISGECCGSKADGKLFEIITNEIHSSNILHIGDNYKCDYLMPKLKGWSSFQIKKETHPYFNLKGCTNMIDKLIVGIATTKIYAQDKYWDILGFSVLGPLLLAYTSWIRERADVHGINRLVFFARDGYIVEKAFKLLYGDACKIKYMYVSRKSAIVANLDDTSDLKKVLSMFKFRRQETFICVLRRLGIKEEKIKKQKDFKIKRKDIYNGKYDEQLSFFYSDIINNALEQKQLFIEYIQKIFDEKTAVIDVGWHGTIQNCIQQILGEKYQLEGFYLGLENRKSLHKEQFLADDSFNANMIPFIRGVFEIFFSAPHASTDGYYKNKNEILPLFSTCNIPKQTLENINRIHKGALEFIKIFKKLAVKFQLKNYHLNTYMVSDMFMKFCNEPRLYDVKNMGELVFNDTVNRKLIDYYGHNLRNNTKAFMQSDWKAGYAKRVFKLYLPYGKIFAMLNKLRRKVWIWVN